MDGVACGHGWHFGDECGDCAHEWEQVWIEPTSGALVGPFRCRKCRIVKPESVDAVDPHVESEGKTTTRAKDDLTPLLNVNEMGTGNLK